MKSILCAVVALAFVGSAVADTINVPAGGDIQAAINGASNGDIIQLEAGEYFPAATINTLGRAVTLRGVVGKDGSPASIIDGQNSIRVLICEGVEGAGTVFENLLITGGFVEGSFPNNRGGGMYNYNNSSPTLINCTFTGNSASGYGGGMYNDSTWGGSSPTLENCTFEGNSAGFGGGMSNSNASNPTLTNCTFTDNSAFKGGGMYNFFSSNPALTGCTFTGNSASRGGGMYNSGGPTLTDCTFTECCQVVPPNSFIDNGGNDYDSWCDDCRANVDCVGGVDAGDLGLILSAWNTTQAQYDIDGDGVVGGGDLGILLGTWGACP